MSRLLVTAGSSYLGQHLIPRAIQHHQLLYTFFSQDPLGLAEGRGIDVRDAPALLDLAHGWRPEVIIHLAGSNRSADMETVICRGTEYIVEAARSVGARLVHISSDVIFDGRNGPYPESARPSPVHAYGRAKAKAEESVATLADHVIIRTSLIYSLRLVDRSTEWIVDALKAGRPVTLFEDQLRNPVWAETLSQACLELAESSYRGIINVAGRQAMSRAEFGLKLLDWWGIKDRQTLTIGPSEGDWPKDCRLDLSLAQETLATPLFGIDEVLEIKKKAKRR